MDLTLFSENNPKGQRTIGSVSLKEVTSIMLQLDWTELNIVQLSRSPGDWVEVSGNTSNDGLSCAYLENGEIRVTEEPPSSVDELITILTSYYQQDDAYKHLYRFNGHVSQAVTDDGYEEWKKSYLAEKAKEKRQGFKRVMLTVAIMTSLFVSGYYLYSGEWKFIGQRTDFARATIVSTYMHHIGKGYYMQTVVYEFQHEGIKYSGTFEAGKRVGKRKVGETIKVKYSLMNPNRSLYVAVYKSN